MSAYVCHCFEAILSGHVLLHQGAHVDIAVECSDCRLKTICSMSLPVAGVRCMALAEMYGACTARAFAR